MKVTGVKTHLVHCPIPEEHRVRSGAGYKLARQSLFVELTTDEGISGFGPCSFGSVSLDLRSVASLLESTYGPAIVGLDPGARRARLGQGLLRRRHAHARPTRGWRRDALGDRRRAVGHPRQGARSADLRAPRRRRARHAAALRQLRVLVGSRRGRAAGAGVPRDGVQRVQGEGRPRREERHRVPARDPRRGRLRRRRAGRREPVLHAAPGAAGRPRAREAERALLRGAAPDRRRRGPSVPGRQARRPHRDGREHVHALGLHAVSHGRRDPRGAGGRLPLRRHQRAAARSPTSRAASTATPSRTRSRTRCRWSPTSTSPRPRRTRRSWSTTARGTRSRRSSSRTRPPSTTPSIELPTGPGLGVEIDWDFVADHPWSDEIGIGLASRPAFGLAAETIPDRTATSLS